MSHEIAITDSGVRRVFRGFWKTFTGWFYHNVIPMAPRKRASDGEILFRVDRSSTLFRAAATLWAFWITGSMPPTNERNELAQMNQRLINMQTEISELRSQVNSFFSSINRFTPSRRVDK